MSVPAPEKPATLHDLRRWLGITVVALAVPLAAWSIDTLADPIRQTLAVPPSATWAAALAALGAVLYIGLLWRPSRSGATRGVLLGTATALVVAIAGMLPSLTAGAAGRLPVCSAEPQPRAGTIDGSASEDGRPRGRAGPVASDGMTVIVVLAELAGAPLEDHGTEAVGGVPGRRCSALVSGSQALSAFPPLRDLLAEPNRDDGLPVWRGELEWWLAQDGRLLLARVAVGGHPADAWESRGLRGELVAQFRPTREDPA